MGGTLELFSQLIVIRFRPEFDKALVSKVEV
jgi:hypothetical protein